MKRITIFISALFIIPSLIFAQDMNPDKALRKADKHLERYMMDKKNNQDRLDESLERIKIAFESEELKKDPELWNVRGRIYNALTAKDVKQKLLEPTYTIKYPSAPEKAFNSFKKNLSLAEKNYEREDALTGLFETASHMSNLGNNYINQKQYPKAFEPLNMVIKINNILEENDGKELFDNEGDYLNQKYVTAVTALQAGNQERSKELLSELYEVEFDNPRVYSNYFNMLIDEDKEKAMKVLDKGQEMYPENTEMLFAEINYYIKQQEYGVLEQKLQEAVERDPDNPSIYLALGNVYNNLFQRAFGKDSVERANKYFDQAKQYFEKTLELDEDNFDATYSIGQLHFNKAAELTKDMNELGMSKEEQDKYNELDKKVKEYFNNALPYFKKAEKMNHSDESTLIALKEIYARQNNFELSKVFKKRVEQLKAGKELDGSYFKANPEAGMTSSKTDSTKMK